MAKKVEFEDLPDDVRLEYISQAFEFLVKDKQVPYGIIAGDTATWDEYDPAIQLAKSNYDNDEDNYIYYEEE